MESQSVSQKNKTESKPIETVTNLVRDYFVAIVTAVIAALVIRIYVVEAYKIPTDFMSPALLPGDHIFVNKLAYQEYGFFGKSIMPKRGDIVVFSFPADPRKDFIKRVIGIPGDTIEIKESVVYLNDAALSLDNIPWDRNEKIDGKSYTVHWELAQSQPLNMTVAKVPPGQIFVLGDNRAKGQDSRNWGFISGSVVKGRASTIWFSSGAQGIRWSRIFISF